MTAAGQPQALPEIAERIELLKTTLGLFAPGEPVPIAAELRQLAQDVLRHWAHGRGVPAPAEESLAGLVQQAVQCQPSLAAGMEICREIVRLEGVIAASPNDAGTQARLVALADAAGELYALVVPRIATGEASAFKRLGAVLALLGALWLAAPAHAEEVSTRYHGLMLLGNLELADGKGPEDGIALIVHGMLAHSGMETIAILQKNLAAHAVSSLAITLSLGQDRRTGFFDCGKLQTHRPYDALDEIDAWIGWLKNNGATDIALIGHSQGGNQVAVFGVERRDPSVSGLILLAPATFEFGRVAEAYRARYDADLPPILDKARALVQAGQGVEKIDGIGFLSCPNATATAESVVGWYTPSPLRNTPSVLPRVAVRTLVIVAGADEVVPDLGPAVIPLARPAAKGRGEIKVRTIEGADHFFRDIYNEDAAALIAEWLKG